MRALRRDSATRSHRQSSILGGRASPRAFSLARGKDGPAEYRRTDVGTSPRYFKGDSCLQAVNVSAGGCNATQERTTASTFQLRQAAIPIPANLGRSGAVDGRPQFGPHCASERRAVMTGERTPEVGGGLWNRAEPHPRLTLPLPSAQSISVRKLSFRQSGAGDRLHRRSGRRDRCCCLRIGARIGQYGVKGADVGEIGRPDPSELAGIDHEKRL